MKYSSLIEQLRNDKTAYINKINSRTSEIFNHYNELQLLQKNEFNKKDAEFTLSVCSWSNCQVVFEKMTPRKMLQQVGTDLFRNQLHPNTWINATFANYQDNNWIITDMRFPNELEAIKQRNGITIRINRGLVERTGKMIQEPEHISENSLDKAEFDYVIENNDTIEELIEQVKKILIKEEII